MEMTGGIGPVRYRLPRHWIKYDLLAVSESMISAKAAVLALQNTPYQKRWTEALQKIQLKREVAGTSRIEGADFTERELDDALSESPEELKTRSQRQAAAAKRTYEWISQLALHVPAGRDLIFQTHRLLIEGADDDHCEPGKLRGQDNNVTFGTPRHRGVNGGQECDAAFDALIRAVAGEYRAHDPLIQALAVHYHFAAMHPFSDGNGRTARALEALLLREAGLRDVLFIAMSNYYYDEKDAYLAKMAEVRTNDFDLTPFLNFGLDGITRQCERLSAEIRRNLQLALFNDMMHDLFGRLTSARKRVIAARQMQILKLLLDVDEMGVNELEERSSPHYRNLKHPESAWVRDILGLLNIGAVNYRRVGRRSYAIFVDLEWPTKITETEFFDRISELPRAKTYPFL